MTIALSASRYGGTAAGTSAAPSMSAAGRFVVWESDAPDMVEGDTNETWDVFLCDGDTGEVSRLSLAVGGGEAGGRSGSPRITPDGCYVAFDSEVALSPADANPGKDVYRLDRATGEMALVSAAADGSPAFGDSGTPGLSADGRAVAFVSTAAELAGVDPAGRAHIFVNDLSTGRAERVSRSSSGESANDASTWPAISGDGRLVAFVSQAKNLAPAQGQPGVGWEVYLHDRATGATRQITTAHPAIQAAARPGETRNRTHSPVSFSADGRYLFFYSSADDLTDDDQNGKADAFRYDVARGSLTRVVVAADGWELDGNCFVPVAATAERFTLSCENGVPEGAAAAVRDIFAVGTVEGGLPPAGAGSGAAAVAGDDAAPDAEQAAPTADLPAQTAGTEPGGSSTAVEPIP
jgi:Tol biopolymer transport system component